MQRLFNEINTKAGKATIEDLFNGILADFKTDDDRTWVHMRKCDWYDGETKDIEIIIRADGDCRYIIGEDYTEKLYNKPVYSLKGLISAWNDHAGWE